jgi:hypothetical protein
MNLFKIIAKTEPTFMGDKEDKKNKPIPFINNNPQKDTFEKQGEKDGKINN